MDQDEVQAQRPARVLLVQEDPRSAALIVEMLRAVWPDGLLITQAQNVADAAQELSEHGSTCVLVDLPGDTTRPLARLEALSLATPTTPIIALSRDEDEELAVAAVRAGAQDCLLESELTPAFLHRAVRYAVERKNSELELSHQALHDPLTGLPNRALLLDRLSVALDRSRRTGTAVCIQFLDVDTFKEINDSLGHAAGDRLLGELAERFSSLLRPMDTVARFGGDEFVFLIEGLDDDEEAMLVAERIRDAAAQPLALDGAHVTTAVSIGIAMITDPLTSIEEALRQADVAMYRAKEQGGSRIELAEPAPAQGAEAVPLGDVDLPATPPRPVAALTSLEQSLGQALRGGELRVHYQPRVSITGDTGLVGFEALVRWQHPERGLLGPDEFLELAEQTGLIVPIGEWVVDQALAQIRVWRRSRPGITISVNLSRHQLADRDLVQVLKDVIEASGVQPEALCVEVTEDTVQEDPETVTASLAALRRSGVSVAIDDFGTGHSSLQSLRGMPIDTLKIHQTFVAALDADPDDSGIVGAVVELGHALGLTVIAEGVETDTQLAHLRELGCDGAQGLLFSAPVPEADVLELLGTR